MNEHIGPETIAPETVAKPSKSATPLATDTQDVAPASGNAIGNAVASMTSPTTTTLVWWKCALIIVGLTALVYFNSFEGQFVFDDGIYINDPSIQTLAPLWRAMTGPNFISRPLIGLSLAINYAISGTNPWSYHAFNLLVHLMAALALFGVVRRTLSTEKLKAQFAGQATFLALAIALIWAVHPLQTQSVTYIYQRSESLMGMCYLLTLYAAIRSFSAEKKAGWMAASIVACTCGMLAKQVMVTAPIVVFLYDYLFVSQSLKAALTRHKKLYAGLAASWIFLALIYQYVPVNPTAGFAVQSITPLDYFKSQFQILVYYLRLALLPDALCIDYAWPKAETIKDILPFAILVVALQGATLWALWRRHPVSFLGIWFFGILALTSSFIPIDDLIFEHRMYLPLAAVITLVVIGGFLAFRRLQNWLAIHQPQYQSACRSAMLLILTLLVVWLGFLTARRNIDYSSELVLWADTLTKRPQNARAHNNYGLALAKRGNYDQGMVHFQEALKYKPEFADAYTNLGLGYYLKNNFEEAKLNLSEAIRLDPKHSAAHDILGKVLSDQGKVDEAIAEFTKALEIKNRAETYYELARLFQKKGNDRQAIDHCEAALMKNPNWGKPYHCLALVFASSKDPQIKNRAQALVCAQKAVVLTQAQDPEALETLAQVYAEDGHYSEAIENLQRAYQLTVASGNKEMGATLAARLKDLQLKSTPR